MRLRNLFAFTSLLLLPVSCTSPSEEDISYSLKSTSEHIHYMWNPKWSGDETNHYHVCFSCKERYDVTPHTFDELGICTECFHCDFPDEEFENIEEIEFETMIQKAGIKDDKMIFRFGGFSRHWITIENSINISDFYICKYSDGFATLLDKDEEINASYLQKGGDYLLYIIPTETGNVSFSLENKGPHEYDEIGNCSCGIYAGKKIEGSGMIETTADEKAYFYAETNPNATIVNSFRYSLGGVSYEHMGYLYCYFDGRRILRTKEIAGTVNVSKLGTYYFSLSYDIEAVISVSISFNQL